ncbi:hypothetical protein [Bacillus cereus]|uniref:Uncharacterized protein n=1 Tax=Bacillus cereus TaxID=1396 RepID=A0A9X7M1U0_BACCE|nr:hypothetical protein [Bacillus cereus]QDZ76967.1 hypothetical protein D0437_29690 [Bacillus cereus]
MKTKNRIFMISLIVMGISIGSYFSLSENSDSLQTVNDYTVTTSKINNVQTFGEKIILEKNIFREKMKNKFRFKAVHNPKNIELKCNT